MARLKVLISAYACEPHKFSESEEAWNTVRLLAEDHDVWVVTRANNRGPIEASLAASPVPHLRFVYYDLPAWQRFWKRGQRGANLYYVLWQRGIAGAIRRLHAEIGFDIAHHLSLSRYWVPTPLADLGIPTVFGPVGGAESVPPGLRARLGLRARAVEALRSAARALFETVGGVRRNLSRCALVAVTSAEAERRLRRLGAARVELWMRPCNIAENLFPAARPLPAGPVRFVSAGRMLHWKGFDIGLDAFVRLARTNPEVEFRFINDGPERPRLEAIAARSGVGDRIRFLGALPSLAAVHDAMADCHVLVHPALHEAFGAVCLEAMAMGRPLLVLDAGGPGTYTTDEFGFRAGVADRETAVADLARFMGKLAGERALLERKAAAARAAFDSTAAWPVHRARLRRTYAALVAGDPAAAGGEPR